MVTSEILRALPASLQWMVLFRISAIRPWTQPEQMQAMFFLPGHLELTNFSHVVLSSGGRYLAPWDRSELLLLNAGELQASPSPADTLFDRFLRYWELFSPDEADCLGLGENPGLPPVLLRAGALAHYSWTGNCNQLFLNHGEIDAQLEAGLIAAAQARTAAALQRSTAAAAELGMQACQRPMAMTCHPPEPQSAFPYGDLVPLGFLLKALDRYPIAAQAVRARLLLARQGKLWPFHTGRLVTAIDSALILQALPDRDAIEKLEQFSDGQGGYYPQLWSETKKPGHMVVSAENAHWCQPDFATTCLARGLRAAAGLPCVTPFRYLEERFETRSGLYFANPYLMDWALAKAVGNDADAAALKARLTAEILAGMHNDYSFGTFDPALSTSLAILSLGALGCRGRLLCLAQLRLVEMMEAGGTWPQCTPFYSTFRRDDEPDPRYELSLYTDTHRIIASGLAIQALAEPCDPRVRDLELRGAGKVHPRYLCRDQAEYVSKFALPAYVEQAESQVAVI